MNYKILIILLFLFSCNIEIENINNLNNNKIEIIGHTGSGILWDRNEWPSNSEPSIDRALLGLNADGVEIDLQMSADGFLVLYHDNYLESLTNCSGCIASQNWEDLKNCTFDRNVGNNLRDYKLTHLSSIIEKYKELDYKIILDIKRINFCDNQEVPIVSEMAEAVGHLVTDNGIAENFWIISREIEFLIYLKSLYPELNLLYETEVNESSIETCLQNDFRGLIYINDDISEEQITAAHQAGLWVYLFSVTGTGIERAIEKSPDGILTENIELMQQILYK